MPSPVGHALTGLAVAWLLAPAASSAARRSGSQRHRPATRPAPDDITRRLVAACAVLAVAPDLDILVTVHRAAWHSVTSAVIAGIVAAVIARMLALPAGRLGLAAGLAWGSHVLLDWLGRDQSPPHGVMALWPFSRAYFESGLDVFAEVSRRYWIPEQFIFGNLRSMVREVAIIAPVATVAWLWRRRHPRPQYE